LELQTVRADEEAELSELSSDARALLIGTEIAASTSDDELAAANEECGGIRISRICGALGALALLAVRETTAEVITGSAIAALEELEATAACSPLKENLTSTACVDSFGEKENSAGLPCEKSSTIRTLSV